jgi:hypothetical protein
VFNYVLTNMNIIANPGDIAHPSIVGLAILCTGLGAIVISLVSKLYDRYMTSGPNTVA